MTDIMKMKVKQVEQLRIERERSKVDDLKTFDLYHSLGEADLFTRAYEKVIAEAIQRGEYNYKFEIEELYGTHYNKINTSGSTDSKIDSFRKANPLKIRK